MSAPQIVYSFFEHSDCDSFYRDELQRPALSGQLFPPDVFTTIDSTVRSTPEVFFQQFAADLYRFKAMPPDENECLQYINETIIEGEYYIYPAGSLGRKTFQLLSHRPDITILGLLDYEEKFLTDLGCETISLEKWGGKKNEDAKILICHHILEPVLITQLLSTGLQKEYITRIKTCPDFYNWWLTSQCKSDLDSNLDDLFRLLHKTSFSGLVLMPRGNCQITNDELSAIFGHNMLYLSFGSEFCQLADNHLQMTPSLYGVISLIDNLQISTVYCGVLVCDNDLPMILKTMRPALRVIHEIYDWACLFPTASIGPTYDLDDAQVHALRVGELFSATHAEAIISKRRGNMAAPLLSQIQTPYFLYFHGFPSSIPEQLPEYPQQQDTHLDIVYAGPLPRPNIAADYRHEHFKLFFEELRKSTLVNFHLYVSNDNETTSELFKDWRNRYGENYSPCVPLNELLHKIAVCDYGLLAFNPPEIAMEIPDIRIVASARAVSYIAAGLPVIIDDTWNGFAELVQEFNAGIIIDLPKPNTLPEKIAERADPQQHREGALRLRKYLLKQNETTIKDLKSLILNG